MKRYTAKELLAISDFLDEAETLLSDESKKNEAITIYREVQRKLFNLFKKYRQSI